MKDKFKPTLLGQTQCLSIFGIPIDLPTHFPTPASPHSLELFTQLATMGGVDKFALSDRQFICVEYPGRVKNIDRAIETLGGQQAITAVH